MKKKSILFLLILGLFGSASTSTLAMASLRTAATNGGQTAAAIFKTQIMNQGTQIVPKAREEVMYFAQERSQERMNVLKNLAQVNRKIQMARPVSPLPDILKQEISRSQSDLEKINQIIKLQEGIVGLYVVQKAFN